MLDPRRLLTFREVARQRSFSRAAESLSLTQPAVSQQIRALETQLGERLIERGRSGFALTAAGELLYEHADALSARLRLAERQLDEAIAEGRRRLRIGAFPTALAVLVPGAIAELSEAGGLLEAGVLQGSDVELAPGVRDGSLHVALCFQDAAAPRTEPDGTQRVDLLEEPMLVALGRRHRLAGRRRIRLAELAHDRWLAAGPDGLIAHACRAAGFEPELAFLTDDPVAINGLVAANLAVTLVSQLLAGSFRGVATPAIAGAPVRRTIYALAPPTGPHPLVAPFLDAVRARAATALRQPP